MGHDGAMSRTWRTVLAALAAIGLLASAACGTDDGGDTAAPTTAADEVAPPDDATGLDDTAVTADAAGPDGTAPAATGWEQVRAPASCQCSDGSPFHYWVRRGDPEKVLFYLNGGGACFSAETCNGDTATYTTDLAGDEGPGDGGIFDLDNPDNPLADHSMVVVPYCTGDLHLGTTEHDYGNDVVVQHKGFVNASTALGAAAALFPAATEVVVAGSSAGSASAPAFGGGAHDVWPDADIAVVADASAAYPGTPEITLAIGSLWGVTGSIPPWPETADLPPEAWSLPGLFVNASAHDPDLRFATFNNAFDEVQASFSALIGVDPSNLVDLIDENNRAIAAEGVDIVNWVSPGTGHTILGNDALYDEEVDDEVLIDWLTAFLAGDEVDDVRCTDCERPS